MSYLYKKIIICSFIFTFNMLQEVTSITLLMLLCQHVVGLSVLQHIICENQATDPFTCAPEQGTIKVVASNYGRTNKTACIGIFGLGSYQLSNDQCFLDTLSTLAQECDRKEECSFAPSNSIFNDPCGGIYKYLNVSYICLKSQEPLSCGEITCDIMSICEYEKKTIRCPLNQNIFVHYANYGRTDSSTCPDSNSTLTSSLCYSDQTKIVQLLCNERQECTLYVSSLVYLDQCPQIYKYLKIFYTCTY